MKASATEIKTHFGHFLDVVRSGEDVIIERSGKELATLLDYKEYRYLKRLDELLLIEKVKLAEKGGYLDNKKSEEFFKKMLGRLADESEAGN